MPKPSSTPARAPPSLKKENSSAGSAQRSITTFFSKKPVDGTPSSSNGVLKSNSASANSKVMAKPTLPLKKPAFKKASTNNTTPVPSSDAVGPSSSQENENGGIPKEDVEGETEELPIRPSPVKRAQEVSNGVLGGSSPSRKAKKVVSYAESDDDDDEDIFDPAGISSKRRKSRPRLVQESDEEDAFVGEADEVADDDDDEDMDDFVVDDDSDAPVKSSKKRKRPASTTTSRKRSNITPPTPKEPTHEEEDEDMEEIPTTSTAQQWKFDPENTARINPVSAQKTSSSTKKLGKEKAHKSEPEKRHTWLASIMDIDRNPIGHPDYDPRTLYIPPSAWKDFSAFETQYWEIKQKFWDTIVFFKKGKFYELYENDATVGHQLFDLKLTDRVNMRMVGVPESSLDHWANQFVAKGFKIARVDQMESALGKEMREADDNGGKKGKPKVVSKTDKIIKRELACVLTGGTLVEGSMLQDDMATFCVAIKEGLEDELPAFAVAFVDTATGQFFLSEFVDDVDLTKFETLIAQIRPQELLLEKSCVSTKALRILKNNINPTTIWNYLKPGSEFWSADVTRRELDCSGYFTNDEQEEVWPEALAAVKKQDLSMSAIGALVHYLRTLKLERHLLTQGNFSNYDPVQKGTTLVLDGQTLINLEIFANTFDGGSNGTLFSILNRCITPFGKRMFKQWVCHPLADITKINERLDAVDMLHKNRGLVDEFTGSLSKMPDLERLISRIHAGSCRPEDFVKVLDGFEQISYTMDLLEKRKGRGGIVDRLLNTMPDLQGPLEWWKTAFDHKKARDHKLLIPEPGVEEEFDASQERISEIEGELQDLLESCKKELKSSKVVFRDLGKEIYQIEVPQSVKNVPKSWSQMSATSGVKRYYFPDLKALIRQLQEAQETHGQIVKKVAGRMYAKFDENYDTWLQAVKIIAHLDCLIGLAAASSALGEPSCRPKFVDSERSVLEFEELRHPCMLPNVTDFIPNDVKLGGDSANINLLTGANAAGKSTVLRMTCTAVIMAQIGCYVPCVSATLTPVDRIMSRLGANDNIFAAQSTFFVELSETKKILSEATPRSLVILDELGRGTSSYDGVAVAQAVLHHVATHIGCVGFFATHYHSLATEFAGHPEIEAKRMQIHVDDENRQVTFLYKLENGVAEGSFGMHCASMCGIPKKVVERAEVAAKEWEHTSRLKESLEKARSGVYIPLGWQSDVSCILKEALNEEAGVGLRGLEVLMKAIEGL